MVDPNPTVMLDQRPVDANGQEISDLLPEKRNLIVVTAQGEETLRVDGLGRFFYKGAEVETPQAIRDALLSAIVQFNANVLPYAHAYAQAQMAPQESQAQDYQEGT